MEQQINVLSFIWCPNEILSFINSTKLKFSNIVSFRGNNDKMIHGSIQWSYKVHFNIRKAEKRVLKEKFGQTCPDVFLLTMLSRQQATACYKQFKGTFQKTANPVKDLINTVGICICCLSDSWPQFSESWGKLCCSLPTLSASISTRRSRVVHSDSSDCAPLCRIRFITGHVTTGFTLLVLTSIGYGIALILQQDK